MTWHDEYRRLDATSLLELLRDRALEPRDLLDAALHAVDALNPAVNAVVRRDDEAAQAQVAAGLPVGPLSGLPVLLKDLGVLQRGTVTTHGLPARFDVVAAADCATVARLRGMGLVLLGKTHSAPLGLSMETVSRRFGATRNPWDPTRSAGGSSGGAAAAVAAGIVPIAQASDGGGSLRLPAACCGVVGLMPTAPRRVDGGPGPVRHVVTRTVRDMALFTNALAPLRAARRGPLRIAVSTSAPFGLPVDPCLVAGVDGAAERAAAAGHHVARADPPQGDERLFRALAHLQDEAAATMLAAQARAADSAVQPGDLEPLLEARLARPRPSDAWAHAQEAVGSLRRRADGFFDEVDLLLQPATATQTPTLGALSLNATDLDAHLLESIAFAPFTLWANAAGLPSMSLPLPSDGLPRGLLVTGAQGSEPELLRFAAFWETTAPWSFPALPTTGT